MKELVIDASATLVALWVCHLIGDWIFQNDWIADRKTKMPWVRALHVTIYCLPFIGLLGLMSAPPHFLWWMAWIWVTHFVIDSYKPLMLFRQIGGDKQAFDTDSFRAAFGTPRGFFVYVTYDQIFHLLTLIPVAWRLAQ